MTRRDRQALQRFENRFVYAALFLPLLMVCAIGALADLISGRKESKHGQASNT